MTALAELILGDDLAWAVGGLCAEARVTRQRDPIRHLQITGGDLGLFDLED